VREERGLAYSVYSFIDAYDEVGCVGAYVGTDQENAAEAVELVMREVADMAEHPTSAEIGRARAMLKSTLLMGLESPMTRSDAAVGQLFTHGRLIASDEIAARILAVSLADIRRVATRAAAGRASLAIVGPADFGAVAAAIAN
jgi:predicted Zn-dependent peptidase